MGVDFYYCEECKSVKTRGQFCYCELCGERLT